MGALDKPREIVIHQSANRPHLLLGGDRELVLFSGLTAACLAFTLATWWGVFVGAAFWLIAISVLTRMGKADPLLRHVYLRHVRYGGYYPAKGHLYSRFSQVPRHWR